MANDENENKKAEATPTSSLYRFLFVTNLPLEHETALFILVSLLDLVSTVWLLYSGSFKESNQVAAAVLHAWGLMGLLIFKFGLVMLICVLTQVIALRRPAVARMLLLAATVLAATVVIGGVLLAALAGVELVP